MINAEYLCQLAAKGKYHERGSLESILEECRVRAEGKNTFLREIHLDDNVKKELIKLGFKITYQPENTFSYLISWAKKDIKINF